MSARRARRDRDAERLATATDPRIPGGDIAGPGGPLDRDAVVIDMTKAVLTDGCTAAMVHVTRKGRPQGDAFGIMLEGRINMTQDRARVLFLNDLQGAADIVAHVLALARRDGKDKAMAQAIASSKAWET